MGTTLAAQLSRLLYGLLVLSEGLSAVVSRHHQLHNARFARFGELASLHGRVDEGRASLLLGLSHLGRVLRVRPTKTRRELGNLMVVARTRGGKGLLATSQLLTWPHSVIVNDIKGDLYAQTAQLRSQLGDVFVFNPTGKGHRHDPLANKRTEDELYSLAKQLLYNHDEREGSIFTERATVMLTQILLAAKAEKHASLPYSREIIRSGLLAAATKLETISPELATQFLDIEYSHADFSDRFLVSAWGTLSARLRPLLTETVVRSLSGSDVRPADLMSKTVTIYLQWPERDLLALSPLVRLMWTSLIDELITTYDNAEGKNCQPVLLLIDEAGRSAIPSLADYATTVAGRGISLWLAVQSLSQLDAVYGKARARVLRDNMETQLYYRPADQETADYLERCLGRKSGFATSQTTHEGSTSAEGLSEQGIPLLTAQEIKQLGDEEIIGFHRNLPPFRAKRMDWRRFGVLRERQRQPAPRLSALPTMARRSTLVWQGKEPEVSPYFDPDALP